MRRYLAIVTEPNRLPVVLAETRSRSHAPAMLRAVQTSGTIGRIETRDDPPKPWRPADDAPPYNGRAHDQTTDDEAADNYATAQAIGIGAKAPQGPKGGTANA